jgi:hypothetical protein
MGPVSGSPAAAGAAQSGGGDVMVRKIRRTVRTSTYTHHSRFGRRGRRRGSTLKATYSGGRRTGGIWSMIPFPRAIAAALGAKWARPKRR